MKIADKMLSIPVHGRFKNALRVVVDDRTMDVVLCHIGTRLEENVLVELVRCSPSVFKGYDGYNELHRVPACIIYTPKKYAYEVGCYDFKTRAANMEDTVKNLMEDYA